MTDKKKTARRSMRDALAEAERDRIEAIEQRDEARSLFAQARDCGRDDKCSRSPLCIRHWIEEHSKRVGEREEARFALSKAEEERGEALARRNDALASLAEMASKRDALVAERDAGVLERANLAARVAELEGALRGEVADSMAARRALSERIANLLGERDGARAALERLARQYEDEHDVWERPAWLTANLPPAAPPEQASTSDDKLRARVAELEGALATARDDALEAAAGACRSYAAACRAQNDDAEHDAEVEALKADAAESMAKELEAMKSAAPPEQAFAPPRTDDGARPCSECRHSKMCKWLLGVNYQDAGPCDWDPSRFQPARPADVGADWRTRGRALYRAVEALDDWLDESPKTHEERTRILRQAYDAQEAWLEIDPGAHAADVGAAPSDPVQRVLEDVRAERARQDAKWGTARIATLPDGTGLPGDRTEADLARERCDYARARNTATYRHVLAEEVAEAFAEADQALLRAELVQVAAVAVKWIQGIDMRAAPPASTGTAPDLARQGEAAMETARRLGEAGRPNMDAILDASGPQAALGYSFRPAEDPLCVRCGHSAAEHLVADETVGECISFVAPGVAPKPTCETCRHWTWGGGIAGACLADSLRTAHPGDTCATWAARSGSVAPGAGESEGNHG